MMIPEWLDHPYWDLDQVELLDWPDGRLPVHRLLWALQAARIRATGRQWIYEDSRSPKLGQRVHIPALAWVDLEIGPRDFGYGCDSSLEVFETDGDNWRPAWQDVRIKRDDAFALWGSPDGASTQQPAVRSGLPGKPTSKHLYLQKLEARIETGEVAGSLEQEATFLKDYLERTYPEAPSSGLSAIRNNIRKRYNEAKRQA